MNSRAAAQIPNDQDPVWILTNRDVDAIVLKDGRSFRIREVTSVNVTARMVRFIPCVGKAETVSLDDINDIVID